jgi:two-component system chemotaxis response regulator CheB
MYRVVVADDSPTVRHLLAAIVGGSHDLTVVGLAADGDEAFELVRRHRPDVVLMDIRMPRVDGFEATGRIMRECPTPIVLITGHADARDADASARALGLGALWVLRKPPGPGQPGFEAASREIVAIVKAMAGVRVTPRTGSPSSSRGRPGAPAPSLRPLGGHHGPLAVAASTGGPAALVQILGALPVRFPVPVLIVQHISPGFVDSFAAALDRASKVRVKVAEQHETLRAGVAYVAPDGAHLGVTAKGAVLLSEAPPLEGFRPSATHLFLSVAEAFGAGAVALILTGMGHDGVAGLRVLRQAGGLVLGQDEATSVVYGMPGVAAREGLVDRELALPAIAGTLKEVFDGNDEWCTPA